jgi:hypothetical protein
MKCIMVGFCERGDESTSSISQVSLHSKFRIQITPLQWGFKKQRVCGQFSNTCEATWINYLPSYILIGSRDSSVDTATGIGLESSGPILDNAKHISLFHSVHIDSGAHQSMKSLGKCLIKNSSNNHQIFMSRPNGLSVIDYILKQDKG